MKDISLRVGGAAGDGIASVGESFCRIFSRNGFYVFGHNGYQSVIRGGHVWFQARASPERIWSQGDGCDLLYALDRQTVDVHAPALRQGGIIVFDPEKFQVPPEKVPAGVRAFPVPTLELARKFSPQSILQNAVGMGACAFLAGVPFATLENVLGDQFRKKKDVLEQNLGAAKLGYEHAQAHGAASDKAMPMKGGAPKLLLTGNQAIALGAASAGLKFLAQYPMTPATSVMHWLAAHATQFDIVVKQAEDELAAINMAIGASYAGVRAMTATSGGGFSLMVEGLGLAGMTETPLVVVEAQRSGPSTGLPTKTEQGDLNMMLGASQGDFPRVILAPGGAAEAFRSTVRAFELAEEFQTPVLLASDLYLSEDLHAVDREELPLDHVPASLFAVPEPPSGSNGYKRYLLTPSGVSPRAIPGQKGLNFIASSDEHDEAGHLISDIYAGIPMFVEVRRKMMEKRMRKLGGILRTTEPPKLEGPANAEVTLVGWGSTALPVRDAMAILSSRGVAVNYLHVRQPFPLHAEAIAQVLRLAKRTLLVEQNYTGQLGRLIRAETGIDLPHKLLHYDGEPLYPWQVVGKVLEVTGRVAS
ncbi:MAG: 2-oxoacid:acceptor oxidoreductase subunit alpha [Euryarchaeota archaeon]|nr:2-oxoacid:acceptor oxidoreductase subunit alpha [Euryarchaeota archaeon]MDE1881223.1 2-oxoacid:acceptor oxidoreductase subunit alpha [Euryarchaeota archaeon]